MKKRHHILLCVLLFFILSVKAMAATSVPDPVLKAKASVVRVLAEYSDGVATGSGFVMKSDREETLIVTNYHVVEGNPHSISVWVGEDATVSARIAAYSEQKDLCILSLSYPVDMEAVKLSDSGAEQGEAVYAVGFPGAADLLSDKEAHTGADATITDGIVSAVREATLTAYGTPAKILQISAAINAGNSGGPLFNAKGEVVGVNTYGILDSQGIFGAIDICEVFQLLQDHQITLSQKGGYSLWILLAAVIALGAAAVILLRKKQVSVPKRANAKAAVICAAAILLVIYPGSYFGARICVGQGNAALGEKLLFLPGVTRLHDPKFVFYLDGIQLLEQRKYSDAKEVFSALPGYRDADHLAQEADYRYALQRADANDFDTALDIMTKLSEKGYADAEDQILEIRYRSGVYLLYEQKQYAAADNLFMVLSFEGFEPAEEMRTETQYMWALALAEQEDYVSAYQKLKSIEDYADAGVIMNELVEVLYLEGQAAYKKGEYTQAFTLFEAIQTHEDSEHYLKLLRARNYPRSVTRSQVEDIAVILNFEDAAEVLVSSQAVAEVFLEGEWQGSGHYFTMMADGSIDYDLPWFSYGDYYKIEDGLLLLYPKGQEEAAKPLFDFTVLSKDCIRAYCFHNKHAYTLYRQ